VPHTLVRRTLVVRAGLEVVRIFDGETLVATHTRSFDRRAQIEDPAHIEALVATKHHAHVARGLDRLCRAAPHTLELYQRLAQRGVNLGSQTARLLILLNQFGPARLDAAITPSARSSNVSRTSGVSRRRRLSSCPTIRASEISASGRTI